MGKYPDTPDRIRAVWDKLGGKEGVDRFLRNELSVSEPTRSWREQDGVIYSSVTSNGTTGKGWIIRLKSNDFHVSTHAKRVLRSPDFKPTNGVTTEIAILKGTIFEDNNRITKKIRAFATERKLLKPNAELACLIRLTFTDAEFETMGLCQIVAMHEPINDYGNPSLLGAGPGGDWQWLSAYCGEPGRRWNRRSGFAFAVSQVIDDQS